MCCRTQKFSLFSLFERYLRLMAGSSAGLGGGVVVSVPELDVFAGDVYYF
ncbi:hypothetical protein HMPREF1861_02435 [Corynebacterium kroppenstedtii]|nr:hypothetical protein HMPREF1861_02435 [Corynebacterium kroppenstedtii]